MIKRSRTEIYTTALFYLFPERCRYSRDAFEQTRKDTKVVEQPNTTTMETILKTENDNIAIFQRMWNSYAILFVLNIIENTISWNADSSESASIHSR